MNGTSRAQRIAEWLIRTACRRLPAEVRAERCREWSAELPAILGDQSIRPSFLRAVRALSFCLGVCRATRQLNLSARRASRRTRNSQWRSGSRQVRLPDAAVRAAAGLVIWLLLVVLVISLGHVFSYPRGWPSWLLGLGVGLAAGFDALCLADIARAAQVRYLPKWAWALICLIQIPLGGIMYLSMGHIGRPRTVPPGDAKP